MARVSERWTCRCGAFSCTFTFEAGAAEAVRFPVSLCAPCCGDEYNVEVEGKPPRPNLKAV